MSRSRCPVLYTPRGILLVFHPGCHNRCVFPQKWQLLLPLRWRVELAFPKKWQQKLPVGSARSSSGKPQNFLIGISSYYSGLPRLSRRGGFHDEIQTNHGASYGRLWGVVPRTQDVWSESAVPMHLSNSLPPAVSARRRPRWQNSPYSRDCGEGK